MLRSRWKFSNAILNSVLIGQSILSAIDFDRMNCIYLFYEQMVAQSASHVWSDHSLVLVFKNGGLKTHSEQILLDSTGFNPCISNAR